MAITVASLQTVVGADIKGALSGMKQVSAGVADLTKKAGTTIPIKADTRQAHGNIVALSHVVTGLHSAISLVTGAFNLLANVPALAADWLGVKLAIDLEDVDAQINAITRDGAKTAEILKFIREEANITPFGFQELAKGAASALSISKQTGIGYKHLLRAQELLVASEPTQNFEGASFALRQAVAGDWVSLQDRFNISPATIQRLKKQTGNVVTIINRALAEQGKDRSLIDKLALTFKGRLSTFLDAVDTIRTEAGKPILTAMTGELERFTGIIGLNAEELTGWATNLGGKIAGKIRTVGQELGTLFQTATNIAKVHNLGLPEALLTSLELRIGEVFGPGAQDAFHGLIDGIKALPATLGKIKDFFATDFQGMVDGLTLAIKTMVEELRLGVAQMVIDVANAGIPGVSEKLGPAAVRQQGVIQDIDFNRKQALFERDKKAFDRGDFGPNAPPPVAPTREAMPTVAALLATQAAAAAEVAQANATTNRALVGQLITTSLTTLGDSFIGGAWAATFGAALGAELLRNPTGGSVSVNFSGPLTVDSTERVKEVAAMVVRFITGGHADAGQAAGANAPGLLGS